MALFRKKLLILCKTYPSPSSKHIETSCVAAMDEDGSLIRLYPVPFRLMDEESQFKKWQWIEADVEKKNDDHRPESHRIRADNLSVVGVPIPTDREWAQRRLWTDKLTCYSSFTEVDAARVSSGTTLALLKPGRIVALEIEKARHADWTDEERDKLVRAQQQGTLFAGPADLDPDAQEDPVRLLLSVSGSRWNRVAPQDCRLGGRRPLLEPAAHARRRLAGAVSVENREGAPREGPDVPDGHSAPVSGAVAHREPDLPAYATAADASIESSATSTCSTSPSAGPAIAFATMLR